MKNISSALGATLSLLTGVAVPLLLSPDAYARPTYTGGEPVATIPDATADGDGVVTEGIALSNLVVSATGLSVTALQSVTLNGLSHGFAGDLQARLQKVGTNVSVYLFAPADGISANFDGSYTFAVNAVIPTAEDVLGTLGNDDVLPDGTYAPADYGGGVDFGERTDFAEFGGLPLDGTWQLLLDDYGVGDTGSLADGWSFDALVAPVVVPEPATGLLLLAGGIATATVRRRGRARWKRRTGLR